MSIDWLQELHGSSDEVEGIGYRLNNIAEALYVTGNMVLAEKLSSYASVLFETAKRINNATGIKTSEDLRLAQEASGNMLRACLAGIEISKKKDKKENRKSN